MTLTLYLSSESVVFLGPRWANDGHIPYHKAKEVFPEELKRFSSLDCVTFNIQQCPGMLQLDMLARTLTSELNIEVEYSKDVLRILLASIIIDLELPGKGISSFLILQNKSPHSFSTEI